MQRRVGHDACRIHSVQDGMVSATPRTSSTAGLIHTARQQHSSSSTAGPGQRHGRTHPLAATKQLPQSEQHSKRGTSQCNHHHQPYCPGWRGPCSTPRQQGSLDTSLRRLQHSKAGQAKPHHDSRVCTAELTRVPPASPAPAADDAAHSASGAHLATAAMSICPLRGSMRAHSMDSRNALQPA